MKAIWNGQQLAESERTVVVEGNHYFPSDSLNPQFFEDSETQSYCAWKGTASYKNVVVDSQRNEDAAWYYLDPKEAAAQIKDHFAFWRGVEVTD